MGKKIIISEAMENELIDFILSEGFFNPDPDKVLIVKKYLDNNFVKSAVPDVSTNGMPTTTNMVSLKDSSGQIVNTMTLNDLFYMIQEKFKNIVPDRNNRDKFLKQIINDWVKNKISREGGLSVNYL